MYSSRYLWAAAVFFVRVQHGLHVVRRRAFTAP
jgi:hypothetical protein